jgi:uncharacterized membrane protein
MSMRPVNIFALVIVLAAAPAGAAMFKWHDANGKVQYGEFPPAGVSAERVAAPRAPKNPPASPSLQQRVEAMDKQQEAEQQRKDEAARTQQAAVNRKLNCDNARKNIEGLNYGGNRLMRAPDGTYQRLDEQQRQQQIEKNQRAITEFCD